MRRKRNARLLGINGPGWRKFEELTSFYDQYSHPSVFAVSSGDSFSSPGYRQIGGEFDTAKLDAYRKEINLRISAGQRLYKTVEVVEKHLIDSKPPNRDREDASQRPPSHTTVRTGPYTAVRLIRR